MTKKPAVAIAIRQAADLRPSRTNSRVHSTEQVDQIVASINTFGWTKPVLIADDEIVAGHGATQAALRIYEGGGSIRMAGSGIELPAGAIPVIECSGWTDEQRRAYVIADNRIAENSTWDESLLKAELLFLEDEGFDLGLTGFDGAALDAALGRAAESAGLNGIEAPPAGSYKEQYGVIVMCADAAAQEAAYEELRQLGYSVKVVVT
jgi:ParB-like chromosome segregation protein Spo0J